MPHVPVERHSSAGSRPEGIITVTPGSLDPGCRAERPLGAAAHQPSGTRPAATPAPQQATGELCTRSVPPALAARSRGVGALVPQRRPSGATIHDRDGHDGVFVRTALGVALFRGDGYLRRKGINFDHVASALAAGYREVLQAHVSRRAPGLDTSGLYGAESMLLCPLPDTELPDARHASVQWRQPDLAHLFAEPSVQEALRAFVRDRGAELRAITDNLRRHTVRKSPIPYPITSFAHVAFFDEIYCPLVTDPAGFVRAVYANDLAFRRVQRPPGVTGIDRCLTP